VAGALLAVAVGCRGSVDAVDDPAGAGAAPAAPERPSSPSSSAGPPPGPGAAPTPAAPAACAPLGPQLHKLTGRQYARTVAALLPGASVDVEAFEATLPPADEGFSNDALRQSLPEPHVAHLFQTALGLADRALEPNAKAIPCPAASADHACVRALLEGFGSRVFRRPLTPAEIDRYVAAFDANPGTSAAVRLRSLLAALFLSPHFLFRSELGDPATGVLTGHERASLLSYVLTDGPPDEALAEAAATGALATREGLASQVGRLLGAPATATGVALFFREHLGTDVVLAVTKDAKAFPSWSPRLAADLAAEADLFVEEAIWRGGGTLWGRRKPPS
jgi:hypothetical protein